MDSQPLLVSPIARSMAASNCHPAFKKLKPSPAQWERVSTEYFINSCWSTASDVDYTAIVRLCPIVHKSHN